MSTEVVRELFRNFENTLHDRLKVIEDILTTAKSDTKDTSSLVPRIAALEDHFRSLDDYAMGQVRTLAYNHDQLEAYTKNLEQRVLSLESSMKNVVVTFQEITATLGMMQKRMDDEKPVEAAEVEAELEETQEAALNAETDAVVAESKAKAAFVKAVEELVDEEEVEEEQEQEEEEQEEEEEEEEEEVELEFEEFEYKKKTYHRDQFCNVYIADEEGCIDPNEVVGIWNPKTKKIDRVSSP